MKGKKILIAGGTGLIGSRLIERLSEEDVSIYILTRSPKPADRNVTYFQWDVKNQKIDDRAVEADYIINLTGAGIADKRWTEKRKKMILDSRINSIRLLHEALTRTRHRPEAILSASAIGYYGDRNNEILNEGSDPGSGFMAECCRLWEKEGLSLNAFTDRLSILRIGIVLSTKGGALPKILMTRHLKVLNYFGSGEQYYSWIHIDDLCDLMISILQDPSCSGVFNGVAPVPLTNKTFVRQIGKGLKGRYLVLPVPETALKLALGEMSDVILNSNRVLPGRGMEMGFQYRYGSLAEAISHLIETRT